MSLHTWRLVAVFSLTTDKVIGRGRGSYAEQVATDPSVLIPLPKQMTYEQGAGFYV